jgi:hypothetical protein
VLVADLVLDVGALLQDDAVAAHDAGNPAANDDLVGSDIAFDACGLADDQLGAANVAADMAVDLQFGLAFQVAGNAQPGIDDRASCRAVGPARLAVMTASV